MSTNTEPTASDTDSDSDSDSDSGPDEAKTVNQVYEDRNLLAVAFAAATDAKSGWRPDPDEDPEEWVVVFVETPYGQVSWHVPRDLVDHVGLPRNVADYDGHGRYEKNERLKAWTKAGCEP